MRTGPSGMGKMEVPKGMYQKDCSALYAYVVYQSNILRQYSCRTAGFAR